MRFRGLRESIAVVFAALVLAALFTYPLVVKFDHAGRVDTNDGKWSIWVVSWVAHALASDPRHLYDANIFYPHDNALTYSEGNLGAGVIGLPMWVATANPYATHNFVVLMGFMLSAVGAYYLCRYLTGSRHAAAVAAVLYSYCPFVFARTAHIQLLLIFGLPFCLLAFHRLVDRTTMGRAVVLGVTIWFTGLTCAYYGIFGGLVVGLGTIVLAITRGRWREWHYWSAIGVAATVAIGLTAPLFIPYLDLQQQTGFARTLDGARTYSANGGAWLASAAWAHRWWLPAIEGFSEVLFPGILTLVVGLAGAGMLWRDAPERCETSNGPCNRIDRGVVYFYVLTAVAAFWVTFGPQAGLYTLLYDTLPVFSFLRAPARAGIVVTLCLVVMAAAAMSRWLQVSRRPWLLTAGLVALAVADLTQAPLLMRDAQPVSEAYQDLARLPKGPVAVFPFWGESASFHGHAQYMLGSTAHWQPLINGYSDHIPQDFRDNAAILRRFPTRESFAVLERIGARYIVVDLNLYAAARPEMEEKLDEFANYLRPLSKVDDTWLFEIVSWPR